MLKKLGMALLACVLITPLCFAAPAPSNTDETPVVDANAHKPRYEKTKKKVKKQKRVVTKAKRKVKKDKDQTDQTQK